MKGWWNIQTSVKPSAITTQQKVGQTLLLYLVTICISYKVPPSMVNQFKGKCANSSSDFRRLKNCNATHLPPPMIQAVEQYLQSEMKSSAEPQNNIQSQLKMSFYRFWTKHKLDVLPCHFQMRKHLQHLPMSVRPSVGRWVCHTFRFPICQLSQDTSRGDSM